MENDEESMRTAATNEVQGAAPVISGGVSARDPEIQAKLAEMSRIKTGDVFRTGLMGAAAGAQGGGNSTNPLAAFVQGAAMGLQVPAQIYAQKQKQIESVMGATPFGVIVPEAQNPDSPYNILAGLPYDLAVKAIAGIAQDTNKIRLEGGEARKTEALKGKLALDKEIRDYQLNGGVDPQKVFTNEKDLRSEFINQIKAEGFANSRDSYFNILDASKKKTAPGDVKMIYSFIKSLDPTSAVKEGEIALAQDTKGIPGKFSLAYNNAVAGLKLTDTQREEFLAEATDSWNRKNDSFKTTVASYRDLARKNKYDPDKVVINIGGVLGFADPTKPNPIKEDAVPAVVTKKVGDVFSESKDGWVSTYQVVNVDGRLGRKRISVVQDTEAK
jgi:hypothetical protein